jgi:hypothetical protein
VVGLGSLTRIHSPRSRRSNPRLVALEVHALTRIRELPREYQHPRAFNAAAREPQFWQARAETHVGVPGVGFLFRRKSV